MKQSDDEKKVKCERCGEEFTDPEALGDHGGKMVCLRCHVEMMTPEERRASYGG